MYYFPWTHPISNIYHIQAINKHVVHDTNLQEMNKLYIHSINTLAFQSVDSIYIQLYISTHAESNEILTHQIWFFKPPSPSNPPFIIEFFLVEQYLFFLTKTINSAMDQQNILNHTSYILHLCHISLIQTHTR